MNYCKHCGAEMKDGEIYCRNCGAKRETYASSSQSSYETKKNKDSNASFGLGITGFALGCFSLLFFLLGPEAGLGFSILGLIFAIIGIALSKKGDKKRIWVILGLIVCIASILISISLRIAINVYNASWPTWTWWWESAFRK